MKLSIKLTLISLLSAIVGALALSAVAYSYHEITIGPRSMSQAPWVVAVSRVESGDMRVSEVRETVLAMLSDEGISSITADRIITCESTWNPRAYNVNKNGSNDAGLWQINSVHGLSVEDRMDVEKSTRFAIKLIKTQGFKPWVCQ